MDLLEREIGAENVAITGGAPAVSERDELQARRSMRTQIARMERELSQAFVTAYPMGGLPHRSDGVRRDPRLLDLEGLERVRDDLAERLRSARVTIAEQAEIQAAHRLRLERMLLEPGKHRFARVACRDLGEPGCGVWQVRPRCGLIGMLMGWWQVKLSSGCPLARGRARVARPGRATT